MLRTRQGRELHKRIHGPRYTRYDYVRCIYARRKIRNRWGTYRTADDEHDCTLKYSRSPPAPHANRRGLSGLPSLQIEVSSPRVGTTSWPFGSGVGSDRERGDSFFFFLSSFPLLPRSGPARTRRPFADNAYCPAAGALIGTAVHEPLALSRRRHIRGRCRCEKERGGGEDRGAVSQ